MSESKLADRFATPNSSKLAQILLDLRGVETQAGICNLQPTDVQLWPETFKSEHDDGSTDLNSQQDTCNCRKSKCLKLYCQCFAARATCSASCRCISCENRPDNGAVRDAAVNIILERNPNAFDSKYRPTGPAMVASTFTAISGIAHKNGCRCRKSLCLKKYCECFQGGVPCSAICTCLTCQNTGPGAHAMSSAAASHSHSASMMAAASAPMPKPKEAERGKERERNAAAASSSVQFLLADHTHLSSQSIFIDGGANQMEDMSEDVSSVRRKDSDEFLNERSVESSGTSDNGSGRSATAVAAGGGVCKPPLAPSHKRKRDSRGGGGGGSSSSSSAAAAAVSDELLMAAAAPSSSQHPSTSSSSSSSSMLGTPASSWSREEQQLLLKQLLYQELESQGILSSPFASFINHNCSGLLQPQSQDSTSLSADISSLLGLSHFQGQQGLVQGGGVSTPIPAPTPALLAAAAAEPTPSASAGTSVGAGVGTKLGAPYAGASPNSISIATAIALLAASHAARGTSAGASAVGHSPYQNQNHQLLQQQHQAYTPAAAAAAVANEVLPFGTIDRIVNNNTVACTPQPLHSSMHHLHHIRHQQQMQDGGTLSQQEQDCTDGETTTGSLGTSSTTSTSGGVRTVRSDSFSDTRPSSLTADHTSCSSFPSKVLFGKDTDCEPSEHAFDSFGVGAPTSTNAAAADVNKGWTGAVGGCQSHQGLGQRLGMSEAGQREKENAGPNSSSSCSLVTMLLR